MAQFVNAQGFPIDARQFLKENTPANKFPQFQAKIPISGIHAGQYTAFDWGNRPSDTPANTGIDVLPSQVIRPVKDGLGMRVQRYYKKKTAFIQTMKIMRQVINEQKKNYSAGLAMNRRREMEQMSRALTNDIRGFTPEMAELYMSQNGRPNNRAIDGNDMNALIRTQESNLLGSELSLIADETAEPSGGKTGAAVVAQQQLGMPDAFALQEQPIGTGEDLPAPMRGERQERLMDSVEALKQLSEAGGISDDLRESMSLSGDSGDDLLGLGFGNAPLAERFAEEVEDLLADEDVLAYEPGLLIPGETFEETMSRLESEQGEPSTISLVESGGAGKGQQLSLGTVGEQQEEQELGRGAAREAKGRARRMIGEMARQGVLGRVRSRGEQRKRRRRRRRGETSQEMSMDVLQARLEDLVS